MRNIIFDWTGVIKDSAQDHLKVVNLMFQDFGLDTITFEELRETWRQPYMDFYNTYLPNLTMEDQKKAYFKAFAQVSGAKPYPGMIQIIKKFYSNSRKMAILSSDSPKSILDEIKNFGLEGVFEDMDLEVHDKVKHIADLMERNAMKSRDTVIIGDTNNEIEAARSVGIQTIAVTWGLCSEKNLKQYSPDYVVHSPKELEKILG
jgi:phosphoglycolate phosphatase